MDNLAKACMSPEIHRQLHGGAVVLPTLLLSLWCATYLLTVHVLGLLSRVRQNVHRGLAHVLTWSDKHLDIQSGLLGARQGHLPHAWHRPRELREGNVRYDGWRGTGSGGVMERWIYYGRKGWNRITFWEGWGGTIFSFILEYRDYFNYFTVKISHALKIDAKCSLSKSFAKAMLKAVLYSTFLRQLILWVKWKIIIITSTATKN